MDRVTFIVGFLGLATPIALYGLLKCCCKKDELRRKNAIHVFANHLVIPSSNSSLDNIDNTNTNTNTNISIRTLDV